MGGLLQRAFDQSGDAMYAAVAVLVHSYRFDSHMIELPPS